MVLSKRERYIFIATVAAFAILGLNYFFVNPLMARQDDLDIKIAQYRQQKLSDQQLLATRDRLRKSWTQMNSGPLKKDGSEAESQFYHSIGDWVRDARMSPPSITKPDRPEKEKDFFKMTFRANGTGGMYQLSRFLYDVQYSTIPVRVTDLVVGSRPDGTDELNFQIAVSTIYLAPEGDKPPQPQPVKENKP